MLVSKHLDQVDQIGVFYLLRSEDVPLVQLLHRSRPVDNNNMILNCSLYIQSTEHKGWSLYGLRPRFTRRLCKEYLTLNITVIIESA